MTISKRLAERPVPDAIASSSALTELIIGRSVHDARKLRNTDVVTFLGGLPEYKVVCSVVAEDALKAAFA